MRDTMDPSDTHRKLTAILSADVAGYSRLMGADEEATIETLTAYRKVFLSYIENHRGRVVDAKGDAILAEFSSVVDAVSSAVEIQRELAAKNAALPDDRRMDFRIGINLGDVVVKDDVIYGDGVNVAARLESLAEPGGICISRPVYDQVESKLKLEYDFLGEQQVKNIAKPVRAYKVLLEPGQAPTRTERALRKLARGWRKAALAATVTVLVALVAALAWNLYRQSVSDSALAAFEKEAAFPLPNKPSIAVLAFDNLSGDPEQEYFSDGLSENLITTLAKIPQLFVIARNSSFKYKGQQVDVRQVGRELGVRYVLEGSVQKAGDHIRITAQLIDAATGNHLWAGSYDREQKDIFQVMDDVTWQVVKELEVKLTYGEMVRHAMKGTKNFAALEIYLKAVHKFTPLEKNSNAKARELALKAVDMDKQFARPIALLGWTHLMDYWQRWSKEPALSFKQAEELANRAIALDNKDSVAHQLLSRIYTLKKRHEDAIAEGKLAVEAEPNSGSANSALGATLLTSGRFEEGLVYLKKAIRLQPFPIPAPIFLLGQANFLTGRYEEALPLFRNVLQRLEEGRLVEVSHLWLMASYVALGSEEEARTERKIFLARYPKFSLRGETKKLKRFWSDPLVITRFIGLLRAAGLPE